VTETPDHHCPGCGVIKKFNARYPWYFCSACLDLAEDCEGNQLVFFNAGVTGGMGWAYRENPEKIMSTTVSLVLCYINSRKVMISEARFGGIVAQPYHTGEPAKGSIGEKYFLNLTSREMVEKARAKFLDW